MKANFDITMLDSAKEYVQKLINKNFELEAENAAVRAELADSKRKERQKVQQLQQMLNLMDSQAVLKGVLNHEIKMDVLNSWELGSSEYTMTPFLMSPLNTVTAVVKFYIRNEPGIFTERRIECKSNFGLGNKVDYPDDILLCKPLNPGESWTLTTSEGKARKQDVPVEVLPNNPAKKHKPVAQLGLK